MKQTNEIYARNAEDIYRSQVLQRPQINDHQHVYVDVKAPFHKQLFQTFRHMAQDSHDNYINVFKQSLTGAVLGCVFGVGFDLTSKNKSALYWKKAINYVTNNPFGTARIGFLVARPSMFIGAALAGTHYIWYNIVWRQGSNNSLCWDLTMSNAVFGMVWTMLLTSPQKWWAGLYGGAFLGWLYFFTILGTSGSKDTQGFSVKFDNGMTQEERQKQEYKDQIHQLGLNYAIQLNKMENI